MIASNWLKYKPAHTLRRVSEFPAGIRAPEHVRVYARRDYFLLQWWDRQAKKTLNQRIDGDLLDALMRAREIEANLNYAGTRQAASKLRHGELVDRYLAALRQRADAGDVSAPSVTRYASALEHFRSFMARPEIRKEFPDVTSAAAGLQAKFAAHLHSLTTKPAGNGKKRLLRSPNFTLDTVRAMYTWALDPDRGNLLPQGFRNPFRGSASHRRRVLDRLGEPDITVGMAVRFIEVCDDFQLRLFAPLMLCGLRAAEPVFLLKDDVAGDWFKVPCRPEFAYATKGRRAKQFPLLSPMAELLAGGPAGGALLFTRRAIFKGIKKSKLLATDSAELLEEFRLRCTKAGASTAAARHEIRNSLIDDAGGLDYDQIEHEFKTLARRLKWPAAATLKDFRHLFASCLENAGVPEFYRRYFMGQSPGRSPIVTYTHLNQLHEQYQRALAQDLAPIVEAITNRHRELS